MTINTQLPDGAMYLSENESLMGELSQFLSKKLEIEEEGIAIAVHFMNAATEEYLDSNHFRICLDHLYRDKLAKVRDITRSFGINDTDVSVGLGSVFLEAQAESVIDGYLDIVERETGLDKSGGAFGSYGVWGVMQRPHFYVPRPTIALWYNKASALEQVVKSRKIPEFLEIDNKRGAIEVVDILHVYAAPKV